jgi:hypothetical protein
MNDETRRVHGLIQPRALTPSALQLGLAGQHVAVVGRRYRMDLQIATWSVRGNICRSYWDLDLADGRQVTVYQDLNHAERWYLHSE